MSEDVSKFLLQIKELGDRRIEEDEARSRELEERILRERKEREARRAERARSISPQKSSPVNTPPPSSHQHDIPASPGRLNLDESPVLGLPAAIKSYATHNPEEMISPRPFSDSASKENESPLEPEDKQLPQTTPTRARGLSWQRRPNSQASERSRSRPLSVVAAENAARNTPSEPPSAAETASKDQIAPVLSFKDPPGPRQAGDEGTTSSAEKNSPVEDSSTEMSRAPSNEVAKDDTDSQPTSPNQHNKLGSPLHLSASQRLDPPNSDAQLEMENSQQSPGMSLSGRTSPSKLDRSSSPTKGMGGFVQSAMMKRSDSIKRWSIQSPTGVPRVDPIVSHRTGGGTRSRPTSLIRDPSVEVSPKPSASQDGEHQEEDATITEKPADPLKVEVKPLPNSPEQELGRATPTTPSKTLDSRRWSPTKSSWLESALNKPESPKRGHTPSKSQPSWMADLQKARAEKAVNSTTERSRSPTVSHKHQVSIGGLMRSSAPGITTKPPPGLGVLNIGGTAARTDDSSSPTKDTQSPITPGVKSPDVKIPDLKSPDLKSLDPKSTDLKIPDLKSPDLKSPDLKSLDLKSPDLKSPDLDRKLPLPAVKPKPDMPPKVDFRANLKPRQPPVTTNDNPESEFKNVFSKLRKTTTQSYVPPDELKDNILKGKASLNLTGGPQKTERVDELKEAILSRKKDFQTVQAEGRGVTRNNSTASETPIPEGIARRNTLLRSNTLGQDSAAAIQAAIADIPKPGIVSRRDSTQDTPSPKPQRFGGAGNPDLTAGSTPKTDIPNIPRRGSAQAVSIVKDTTVPDRLQGKPLGGGLAGRFNPALAGLIARGPPGVAPGSSSSTATSKSRDDATDVNDNKAGSGPKLTHMTKGRARGPKRNAPTSITAAAPHAPEETPSNSVTVGRAASPEKSLDSPPNPEANDVGKDQLARPSPPLISPNLFSNPFIAAAASEAGKAPGPSKIHEQVAAFANQRRPRSPTKVSDDSKESTSQPSSPKKLDARRMSRFLDDATTQAVGKMGEPQVVKNVKGDDETPSMAKPKPGSDKPLVQDLPKSQPQSPPLNKSRTPLPDPLSLGPKKLSSNDTFGSSPSPEVVKTPASIERPLPAIPTHNGLEKALPPRPLPEEPKQLPQSPPNRSSRTPPPTSSPIRSPSKQSFEASTLLGDFFGSERTRKSYNVDAAELLMHRLSIAPPKIQTLSAQLFQFSADGKKLPVPAHNERTLFEGEMYICTHTFKDESGRKFTEVYFWAGDDVPRSTVDDASLFVSREARALGGKLVKLYQGKETPEFLQALGGIVIVQRGSGNKFDSLAPHILCGRRYRGHIVFDEVDFAPTTLCSGFPYVVSTGGKCYLWKGKGSGVDELSCARLIGMDYALSGEMEEIEDGHEPASFWDLFNVKSKAMSADHWRLKPSYDKYCCRLFCSNAASKQQIVEISPFSQADLRPTNIYVLDAFFELYIIVGSRAQAQYASFHNALDFAQEYGILAAGMEDRPFVPFSTVVLEGIPRDMKSVFRKWRDAESPTITNVSTGLKRGRSLRVVPLNQALQALSD
ncbi:uncharacterized protein F4812DRAFT_431902 [Daldinia caldariorum]|uniref:uncharacterized protein n=1 Tax=Daldinia caldariorum TaxID=326644 RepID=UPI0020083436|nr:uncharacterized protein F4812DRAFT_431902 [Daldinia caldariorum]KAI1467252.1 hypothetical protein F4812DRAFT_431902 [Daldinia caldariorum]